MSFFCCHQTERVLPHSLERSLLRFDKSDIVIEGHGRRFERLAQKTILKRLLAGRALPLRYVQRKHRSELAQSLRVLVSAQILLDCRQTLVDVKESLALLIKF
jgi:hypothetical protein